MKSSPPPHCVAQPRIAIITVLDRCADDATVPVYRQHFMCDFADKEGDCEKKCEMCSDNRFSVLNVCAFLDESALCQELSNYDVALLLADPKHESRDSDILKAAEALRVASAKLKIVVASSTSHGRLVSRIADSADTLILTNQQQRIHADYGQAVSLDLKDMAAHCLIDLMTTDGLVGLDFEDFLKVLWRKGFAAIGVGEARSDQKAIAAARNAVVSLSENSTATEFSSLLINVTGGPDMTLNDVDAAARVVQSEIGPRPVNVVFGSTYCGRLNGAIRVTVIAAGFPE